MRLRSLLFVPGDRPERFAKAAASGADAVILDLEDSVAASARPTAREAVAQWLREPATVRRFVRVNPLGTEGLADDLAAARGADAVMLPKAERAEDVTTLVAAMGASVVPVLPVATETPLAIFGLGGYSAVADRLAGLTWGAEDLPAAIGATTSRETDGCYTPPYEVVRTLALMGAHAAGVAAIETVYPNIKDSEGLAAYASRGARDGFTGMMAIHPTQVSAINAAFSPSVDAVAAAERIIAAFAANPGAGTLQLDGRMIDAPHLKQARAILARSQG
ncbi:citrate lyase subunit beta/citryl-CoA lyase [Sphingomonas insulae]|uniref:CoA ester lyase n=1 Tax=Sphingomonas insulae TaxID=424800 RepID=A0ABP3SZP2_9SPHN|nr:CoA ester lyase [Sphingomonas insulae]NIJ30015.1 citrate lyase subunit beta/citryl-CoA lyase [Sphingomonas insulae]